MKYIIICAIAIPIVLVVWALVGAFIVNLFRGK